MQLERKKEKWETGYLTIESGRKYRSYSNDFCREYSKFSYDKNCRIVTGCLDGGGKRE